LAQLSWLAARRRGRGRAEDSSAPGLILEPWGEAGPPEDYDPDAVTTPLMLAGATAQGAGTPLHARREKLTGTAGARKAGTAEAQEARTAEAEDAGTAGPGEAGTAGAGGAGTAEAGKGRPSRQDETLETTIIELPGQMGYPREVVPSAELPSADLPRAELVAIVSSGEGTELPHWADPPTGEVPSAIAGPRSEGDELQAWRLLGSRGLHWRDDVNDWSDSPGVEDLVDEDDQRNGMRDEEGAGSPFSFDEDFERLEHERAGHGTSTGPHSPVQNGDEPAAPAGPASNDRNAVAGDETGVLAADFPGEPTATPDQIPAGNVIRTGRRARKAGQPNAGEPVVATPASARHTRSVRGPYDVRAEGAGMGHRDVGAAVVTGIALLVLLVVCYLIGSVALLVFSAVAVGGCAIEAFSMLQRAGFRPATLLGVVGSAGAVAAAYWRGTEALPVVIAVVVGGSLVWYLARVVDARPVVNAAVSVLAFCWVGVLGSFAGLLLAAHHGSHLFLGAVVPTIAADVVAWFIGSQFGSHPLAPAVSPSKTWEGVIAGGVAALVAGAIIGNQLAPWGGARHGLELGLVVAVMAPIGDLVQSMLKRDLRMKDSGTLLPGHGGLLDRFDSLLFVLPATYFLAVALHIVVTS
jgi:phosphatidate cytidylyltransferase